MVMDANLAQVLTRLSQSYKETARMETNALLKELEVARYTMARHMDRSDRETTATFKNLAAVVEKQAEMTSKDLKDSLKQIMGLREFAAGKFGGDDKLVEIIDQVIKKTQGRSSFKSSITQTFTENTVKELHEAGVSLEDAAKAQVGQTQQTSILNKVMTKFVGIMAKRDLNRVGRDLQNASLSNSEVGTAYRAVKWSDATREPKARMKFGRTEEGKVFMKILQLLEEQGNRAKREEEERRREKQLNNQQQSEAPADPAPNPSTPNREPRQPRQRDGIGRRVERGAERGFGAGIGFTLFKAIDDVIRLVIFPIAAILGAAVAGWVARGGGGILTGLKKAYDFFMEDILPKLQTFFTDKVVPLATKIYEFFDGTVVPLMKTFYENFLTPLGKWLMEMGEIVGSKFLEGFSNMKPKLEEFYTKVLVPLWQDIMLPFFVAMGKWYAILGPIYKKMAAASIDLLFDELGTVIDLITTWFTGFKKMVDAFKDMLHNGLNADNMSEYLKGFGQMITALPEFIIKTATNILAWLTKVFGFNEASEALRKFAADFNLSTWIANTVKQVGDWITGMLTKISDVVKGALDSISTIDFLKKIGDFFKNMFSFESIRGKLEEIARDFSPADMVKTMFTELGSWLKRIFDIDWTGIVRNALPTSVANLLFGAGGTPTAETPTAPAATDPLVIRPRIGRSGPQLAPRVESAQPRGGVVQTNERVEAAQVSAEERSRRRAASTQGMGAGNTVNSNITNNSQNTMMPVTPRNNDPSLARRGDQNVNF